MHGSSRIAVAELSLQKKRYTTRVLEIKVSKSELH